MGNGAAPSGDAAGGDPRLRPLADAPRILLVRHGETEWTRLGRHTGRTDIPLTEHGRREAEMIGGVLAGLSFARVLASPLSRTVETCRIAGLGDRMALRDDLLEWDHGIHEGRTTDEVQREHRAWSLFLHGAPGGESAEDVGRRADRVIAELHESGGNVAVFSHGHLIRVLIARWLEMAPAEGRRFASRTAAIGTLGYDRGVPVLVGWNDDRHLAVGAASLAATRP